MGPSNSTYAGLGLGIPAAIILSWLASLSGIEVPGEVQSAFGAVIATVAGYFFKGGQRETTTSGSTP